MNISKQCHSHLTRLPETETSPSLELSFSVAHSASPRQYHDDVLPCSVALWLALVASIMMIFAVSFLKMLNEYLVDATTFPASQ